MEKQIVQLKNQVSIAYVQLEPAVLKEDFTLVFLHEALGSIGQWKQFPQLVCDALGAKGLIYERQGYGSSSPLTEKRTANYLENYALLEMPLVINQLLPDQKILPIGHSDGGSIALLYASKYPEKIVGVVTMAAHVFVEKETIDGIYPAMEAYQQGKLNGLQKYHGDKTETIFKAWAETWLEDDYRNWNICPKIKQNLPSLILQGDQDEYGTEKQLNAIKKHLLNVEIQLLEGIHHQPHLENPEEIVARIKRWFNQNNKR